jgi:peptide-methionine (S)-S-oxide reductase
MFFRAEPQMPAPDEALPGRDTPLPLHNKHYVLPSPMRGDFEAPLQTALFGLGCFWGAEKKFWALEGVITTAVGYSGGYTPNPTYREVCSGRTGHNEVVWVVFDPSVITYEALIAVFFESHNPTQGMRQGNDVGTQYRSGIYCYDAEQQAVAQACLAGFQKSLTSAGYGSITTEIVEAGPFYYAEDDHQQYLAKNPAGYCGLGGTGVACPIGLMNPSE